MNHLALFMMPSGAELLIVLMVIVLLFGAGPIPDLARASGRAIGEFQRGRDEVEREIREAREAVATETVATDAESPAEAAKPQF